VPGFGMRRFPHALIAIAAVILGLAGCLAAAAGPARAASDFSLVILPDQGENAIYNFVNSATSSVNVTIYELNDTTLVGDLVAREKAGVTVRVILDQAQKSYNTAAYNALTAGGVGVVWSSTAFTYTHQKTITVNNDESYISSGNFDTTYYATSRDYGVFDTDASDVAAIVAVFNADYAHSSITPSDGDDLVWSPTDSQTHLLSLINGATASLDIEEEEFSDTAIINAIVAAENRGVKVRVVLEDPSDYSSEVSEVENAGGQVTGYSSSTGFYIHAKAIIADYGTSAQKAFVGSENLTSNSLNDNRELGLITSDAGIVDGLESTFDGDFSGSAAGKVSVINPGAMTTAVGGAVDYQVQAADTCTGSLSYAASGLPKGLSINSSTGVISGTASTAGTYNVTVTGTDSTGPSGSATFTWTVGSRAGDTVTVTNPGSQSGTAGTAASLQIQASDSASGQTLTYSASGLPAGLSIGSSTGLISGTPTAAGTSTVTVTATDTTGASGSASFTWTISSSSGGGGCPAQQLLVNGGFETGSISPWTASSGVLAGSTSAHPAQAGDYLAWIDGYSEAHVDTLAQTVTIPANCVSANLTYWVEVNSTVTNATKQAENNLVLEILNSSGTVEQSTTVATAANNGDSYVEYSASLAAYIGQTITIKFIGTEISGGNTQFLEDSNALNVS
jgi:Putative Ig domain/PLD-like domain